MAIKFIESFSEPLDYLGVVAFVGQRLVVSWQDGRGAVFPLDICRSHETVDESVAQVLFDQTGSVPLLSGVLAQESLPDGKSIGYCWAVLEALDSSDSMVVHAAQLVTEKELTQMPFIYERKVLYDAGLQYAKIVEEKLLKVS